MKTYNVHVFQIVRQKHVGIRAKSRLDAIRQVREIVTTDQDMARLLLVGDRDVHHAVDFAVTEHAEVTGDAVEYLVDVQGDPDYRHSRWYAEVEGETPRLVKQYEAQQRQEVAR